MVQDGRLTWMTDPNLRNLYSLLTVLANELLGPHLDPLKPRFCRAKLWRHGPSAEPKAAERLCLTALFRQLATLQLSYR